jgi:hypothetical protein
MNNNKNNNNNINKLIVFGFVLPVEEISYGITSPLLTRDTSNIEPQITNNRGNGKKRF